jgi:hypothetical protein
MKVKFSLYVSNFIHSSMALQPFAGPWPLLQFLNLPYTGGRTPWTVISPSQGRYLHAGQYKHGINANIDIHVLNEIRTHDPSIRESEECKQLAMKQIPTRSQPVHLMNGHFQALAPLVYDERGPALNMISAQKR